MTFDPMAFDPMSVDTMSFGPIARDPWSFYPKLVNLLCTKTRTRDKPVNLKS